MASLERRKMEQAKLCDFSDKIVDLLVGMALQALQEPEHGGLDFAVYLLLDAQKYAAIYPNARAISNQMLLDAAKKLNTFRNWFE